MSFAVRANTISVVFVPNEQRAGVSRYETIIATLVGVSALFVSGYTAHVQRQQVRAAVWPILEYTTSNEPTIRFTLQNKGVGPAIIRHVEVTLDGKPVLNWHDILQTILGPGEHQFSESTISGHVLSAGETMQIMVPYDSDGTPMTSAKGGPLWDKMNPGRGRVGVEICYASTLGDCWILRSDGNTSSTTAEARACPGKSQFTFQQ